MSIWLEGSYSEGSASSQGRSAGDVLWSGHWQFAKEKKLGPKFVYQRVSNQIPVDLIHYVSFEDKEQGDGQKLVEIERERSMYGLWAGSFEVNVPQSTETRPVEETFFICGRQLNTIPQEVTNSALSNLPPAPSLSHHGQKRFAVHLERETLFGFGRNKYGRFSIVLSVDIKKGIVVAEKRYLVTKYANLHHRAPSEPVVLESRPKGERVTTRKKFDDETVAVDQALPKRRKLTTSRSKGPETGESHELSDEAEGGAPDEEDDFKAAFLDDDTGEIYEGGWQGGYRHGIGICVYADGTMYEGGWSFGREQGHGVLMTGTRQVIYSGEWSDGCINGHGCYQYPNGDVYTGDWKEGFRHGKGDYSLSNGCRYVGDWKENKRQGKGIFTWSDGSCYDGDWENDMRHGRGVLHTGDGFHYDGLWANNYMDGRGVCRFPDGQEYHGTYKLGLREGRGSISFPQGCVYEGRFREDRIDGQGTIKIEKIVSGTAGGELLIPIQIQADIRRIHLKAGFGKEELH